MHVPVTYEPADPHNLGMDRGAVDALLVRARREIDDGLLPSCQLALARHGRLAVFATLGAAAASSRYVIFSCTKAVVAGAAWMLIGEGKLDPARRVGEYVPEFGTNGKDAVTVEQLFLHTAGVPRAPLPPREWGDRAARLRRFAAWRLNWEPGSQLEYHATSAHWVLAELIERLSGIDYREFIARHICAPLGLRSLRLGVPPAEQGDINPITLVGEPPTPEEFEKVTGLRGIDLGEITDQALLGFNHPAALAAGVPGAGAVATAADIALYYQALLQNPDTLWDPDVLADATGRVRTTYVDPTLFVPANRSLGLVIAGDDGLAHRRGMGKTTSARTFGHNGAGGQVAWADPETGLSFCYLTNGLDRNLLRAGARGLGLTSRAAACAAAR
jgi:CubicO group peptidase (beta-lactamase class C family)